jgi:hypothetical protein
MEPPIPLMVRRHHELHRISSKGDHMSTTFGSSFHEGLTHRLSVIGCPIHIIKGLANDVMKWVRCSGAEWTIKRLKSLKVDILRQREQLPPLSPFRKNRRGEITGSLGSLLRFADRNDDCFGKAIQASQIYTAFKFESLTQAQAEKFQKAISAKMPPLDASFLRSLGRAVKAEFPKLSIDRNTENSLLCYRGSPSKFKPRLLSTTWTLAGLRKPSRKQDEDVLSNAEYFLDPRHVPLYFEYQDLYDPVLYGLEGLKSKLLEMGTWYRHESLKLIEGGEIHFLQEQGGKLRSVASPHLVHQLALKPFGDAIYKLVRSLPWDCTFNQSKPFDVLQTHLKEGHTIHSVDLSSATDYFPLEVQMTVLRSLIGNSSDVRLFEALSQANWRPQDTKVPSVLKWTRGQPLGLYPSFGVFTLSHGVLLWWLNGCEHKEKFYVLGDDVVILDNDLYNRYIQLLQQMDCPYSREKSISGSQICEFAGKIVTRNAVIPQYKWREVSNDNFLDICRHLGRRSRSLLTRRQQAVFDKVEHCILPWGLNFSFPGSNLEKMTLLTKQLFADADTVVGSMMGLSSTIHRNVYGDSHFLSPHTLVSMDEVLKKLVTFDEKVRSVLLKVLSQHLVSTFLVFLKDLGGLSGVPEAVTGNSELPSLRVTPSRVSLLERMEKILSLKDPR